MVCGLHGIYKTALPDRFYELNECSGGKCSKIARWLLLMRSRVGGMGLSKRTPLLKIGGAVHSVLHSSFRRLFVIGSLKIEADI